MAAKVAAGARRQIAVDTLSGIDAVILAGGFGTRLAGVLPDRPKALAPVGGRPFLDHLVRHLAAQGIRRVVLCLGHRANQILDWLAGAAVSDIEFVAVIEPTPLGTAGAIANACRQLRSDPVLIMNGDTYVDADLDALLADHRAADADVTLLCTRVVDTARYGSLETDSAGRVRRFREKGTAGGPGLVSAGVYVLGRRILDRLVLLGAGSLERDVLERLPAGTILAHETGGRFIDIGTPESLSQAAAVVVEREGSLS